MQQKKNQWQIKVNTFGIVIRREPIYPGQSVGLNVSRGEVLTYSEKRMVSYDHHIITFYKLSDERGWVHNFIRENPSALNGVIEHHKKIIWFEPRPMGISFKGNRITAVKPDSQAQNLGVCTGWTILEINGQDMDAKDIFKSIDQAKEKRKPFTIMFETTSERYSESLKEHIIKNQKFPLPVHYKSIQMVGAGAYGIVICAMDTRTNKKVAIKKINDWCGDWADGLRILREVKLLNHFKEHPHPNLVSLNNLLASPLNQPFDEVYVIMDHMDTDMHKIIYSKNKFGDRHLQTWVHSILKALRFMHSGKIIHRDLKPSNVLINKDCSLKLCDFGLARGIGDEIDKEMTKYVVTRWYRAPELLLSSKYDTKIDVWSLGCILGELLQRKPMFPGDNYIDQLKKILDVIGTPSKKDILSISSHCAQSYLCQLAEQKPVPLNTMFANASEECLDLLKKMLTFNPKERISVEDALNHTWIKHLGTSDDDVCTDALSFDFESQDRIPKNNRMLLKEAMWCLIRELHPEFPKKKQLRN